MATLIQTGGLACPETIRQNACMNRNVRIAILASGDLQNGGGGTTLANFIRGTQLLPELTGIEVGIVICNNSPSKVGVYHKVEALEREFNINIPVLKINTSTPGCKALPEEDWKPGEQSLAEAALIQSEIEKAGCSLTILMGYMKKTKPPLTGPRVLNNHPGPLPQTKGTYGIGIQQAVYKQKLGYSGHTLHLVTDNYDSGQVIIFTPVMVEPDDTPEITYQKVQIVEKSALLTHIPEYLKSIGLLS